LSERPAVSPSPMAVPALLGAAGGAAWGAYEVARVLIVGRLAPGPFSTAALVALGLLAPALLGAIAAGLPGLVPRLRASGRVWPLLVGLWAPATASLAITWFSDPAPFTEPWPLQGNPVAFLVAAALPLVAIVGLQVAQKRTRAAAPVALVALGGVAAALVARDLPEPRPARSERHPNVLLVTLDTTRADRFGAHPIDTSAFDRIASEGVRFDLAMAQIPVTGPSHATILLGQPPWEHGVLLNGRPVPPDRPTLAQVLHGEGYATGAFVSAYVLDGDLGFARGFEVYDDDFGAVKGLSRTLPGRGIEMARRSDASHLLQRRGDLTVDAAIDWLDTTGEAPFFAWVHLFDAHGPYEPPHPYDTRYYAGGDPKDPQNRSMEAVKDLPAYLQPSLRGVTDREWVVAQYDGEVAYADDQLERLLTWLDDRGVAEDTLVIVTADHGEGLGEEGEWFNHGDWLYAHDLHVPLAMRFPGHIEPGQAFAWPVELADLAPTVLSWAGFGEEPSHSGADLRDAVEAKRRPHVQARALVFDREANRKSRESDPDFPPTWRMASVRGPEDHLVAREHPEFPTRYWIRGAEQGAIESEPDAEKKRLRELLEQTARNLFEKGAAKQQEVSDAERKMLEELGYIEQDE
jgi:arylsulfatase A-like enzyme